MLSMQAYVPINCEFHDVLEATAVRGRAAVIRYLDEHGALQFAEARIRDLYARNAMEYMQLDDGSVIRLDQVVSVDGVERSAFGDACALPDV
jgi:Rho-binding antiterminator